MKTKRRYMLFIGIALPALLLLNGLLFYSAKCSGEYLQSENVWGTLQSVRARDYKKQQQIIDVLPEEPERALEEIDAVIRLLKEDGGEEWEDYEKYRPMGGTGKREEDLANYEQVRKRIQGVEDYGSYILGIKENAKGIAEMLYSIYEDRWLLKNVARCEQDYYGLEYLQPQVMLDNTVNLVLNYHVTDLLAFSYAALLAAVFCYYLKYNSFGEVFGLRRVLAGTLAMMVLGIAGFYVTNFCIVGTMFGAPSLTAPIQSLEEFYTCPYTITIGSFLAVYICGKVLGQLLLLAICFCAVTSVHRLPVCFLAAAGIAFEYWRCIGAAGTNAEIFLREVNLFSAFTVERFLNRYLNLNLAGRLLPRAGIFAVVFTVAFVVMMFLMYRRLRQWHRTSGQEVMNAYLGEIDRRYQETRLLWHDFNNHLLAIKALYENGRKEQAAQYIDDLTEYSHERLLPAKTGSDTLDLLLFKKYQQANEEGVKLQFKIGCSLAGISITEYDLCSLFGNLLDNAIEAVQKCKDTREPVFLRVERQNNMLFISCENSYEGELSRQDGELKTTKKDAAWHGIGLASVRQVCRKYKGSMEVETENQRFCVSLLLNL